MKVRTMWDDNSNNPHLCEELNDNHSETMQDGYMYRLSDILANYSQQELLAMEHRSKLAYESVERKVFFDDMDPKDVERYHKLKAEKEKSEKEAQAKKDALDKLMKAYSEGKITLPDEITPTE